MKLDGIIFDLDGTLWDSAEGVCKTWSEILSKYDYKRKEVTLEEMGKCMGKQLPEIAAMLFPELEEDVRMSLMNECSKRECEYLSEVGGRLFDGLEDTLKKLSQKHKLFIVSNCQEGYIEAFYKAHKLEKYFIDFENSGRTRLSKGENIKLIIERNNLNSSVYVGDTEGDRVGAELAEIPFVYASYGFGDVEKYDYKIDDIRELLNVIEGE